MAKERVLITVKTYPTLSHNHVELVCTAGFREDGTWVRIYPVPFDCWGGNSNSPSGRGWSPLNRRTKDHRPESYSPADRNDILIHETIDTADGWRERKEWALNKGEVWTDLTALIAAGKRDEVSLATFRPAKMIGFEWAKTSEPEWRPEKLSAIENQLRQQDFLDAATVREDFKPVRKLPYDFFYRFQDESGRESRMRILDWEIGMLYWNCLEKAEGSEGRALEKVRQRYETEFFSKDCYLFLGTTYEWHDRAPNPWVIIGVFPPPQRKQLDLF